MQAAVKLLLDRDVSLVVHLGDWSSVYAFQFLFQELKKHNLPLKGVLGNNDASLENQLLENDRLGSDSLELQRELLTFTLEGRNLAATHGDNYKLLRNLIQSSMYDAIFYGHTHRAKKEVVGKTLVVNPGSTTFSVPCSQKLKSLAIYDTKSNSIDIETFTID